MSDNRQQKNTNNFKRRTTNEQRPNYPIMKILNLSIEIVQSTNSTPSMYMSRRSDFISRLTQLSELTQ